MTAHPLATEAQDLDARIRHHKRELNRHRRRARECKDRLREVLAECARLGIEVIITAAPATNGTGDDAHGRPDPRPHHPR